MHIVGGGAQSDVWCQIFADVLNVEIRQVKDPIQANARGAAFIAAAGLGEISLYGCPRAGGGAAGIHAQPAAPADI